MELEGMLLSVISHTERDKCCMIFVLNMESKKSELVKTDSRKEFSRPEMGGVKELWGCLWVQTCR